MSNIVDARGLSCPQPVIMVLNKIKSARQGDVIIMVDTDTAKENVSRLAIAQGWNVAELQSEDYGYKMTIRKGSQDV